MKKTRQVFNKSILIATNDPDNDQLQLKLRGSGVTSYMTMPNGRWDFGAIAYAENEKAKEVKGYIFSKQHEHLELKNLSLSNDRFSFSVEPIDEENKKKFQAKSGYAITVKTDERIPVGAIFDRLKFTVVGKHFQKDGSVRIRARRIGPFIFQPFKDVFWIPKDNALDLGTISAKKGISKKVTMLVTGMGKQDLKILNYVKKTPKFLNLKMIKDPTFESETQQRYELVFEIPPNQPPSTYLRRNPGVIELETNHPTAKLMRFYIEFISN